MDNIINDDGSKLVLNRRNYVHNIILNLRKTLPRFNEYLFIDMVELGDKLPMSRHIKHDNKILFWEGGEHKEQRFLDIKRCYKHIFASYTYDHGNVHTIPLGYWGERGDDIEMKKFSERLFNITFSGCLNRNRIKLASLLSEVDVKWIALGLLFRKELTLKIVNGLIKWKHNQDRFLFTDNFGEGNSPEDYQSILKNSKIVVCPRGWVNAETYRLCEAIKLGCVVISEKLPDRYCYKSTPIIEVEDWETGLKLARDLIKDVEKMETISKQNVRYYKDVLSPTAVAKRIRNIII